MNESEKQFRVMIIDDDPIDQKLSGRVLKRAGSVSDVVSFQYAEMALEYLLDSTSEPIDAILLDVNIPRMSGIEFLRRATQCLEAKFTEIPVIVVTTSIHPKDRTEALCFENVGDVIEKPLSAKQAEAITQRLRTRDSKSLALTNAPE